MKNYLNKEGLNYFLTKIKSYISTIAESKADGVHASQHSSNGSDPISPFMIGLGNTILFNNTSLTTPTQGDITEELSQLIGNEPESMTTEDIDEILAEYSSF